MMSLVSYLYYCINEVEPQLFIFTNFQETKMTQIMNLSIFNGIFYKKFMISQFCALYTALCQNMAHSINRTDLS